jgi:hypothetical protein
MVKGLEKFKEHFAGFEDNYVIIGGTACDILCGGDKEPVTELFRFINPINGFPVQIELLSKYPNVLGEPTGFHLTPIPVGEDISSLSAILMDEEYYHHTIDSSIIEEGVRIANPLSLLCLKVKAFLNLTEEKKTNPNVRSSDIKKHRDDVFKLLAMRIDPFTPIELSATMKKKTVCLYTI